MLVGPNEPELNEELPSPSDDEEPVGGLHKKLLTAVSQLYNKQRVVRPQRSEPAVEVSEFHLSSTKTNENDKNITSSFGHIKKKQVVTVGELTQALNKRGGHKTISDRLKLLKTKAKTLPTPVEKIHADKIARVVGYNNLKRHLSRWEALVHKNRAADQIIYPLIKKEDVDIADPNNFLTTFKKPTELELQVAAILDNSAAHQEEKKAGYASATVDHYKSGSVTNGGFFHHVEEELYPLSIEEMVERRKMLARVRAQESYKIAKAARQNKIKSKKYHRILRQERIKEELKAFEALKEKNPEAALEKLEQLERARAEERASLRHRNTGQWAKSRAVRAKYNKEARAELAEQLSKSRELTQKLQINDVSNSEEEEEEDGGEGMLENGSSNPWISNNGKDDSTEMEAFISGYKKFWDEETKKKTTSLDNKSKDTSNSKPSSDRRKENNIFEKEGITAEDGAHEMDNSEVGEQYEDSEGGEFNLDENPDGEISVGEERCGNDTNNPVRDTYIKALSKYDDKHPNKKISQKNVSTDGGQEPSNSGHSDVFTTLEETSGGDAKLNKNDEANIKWIQNCDPQGPDILTEQGDFPKGKIITDYIEKEDRIDISTVDGDKTASDSVGCVNKLLTQSNKTPNKTDGKSHDRDVSHTQSFKDNNGYYEFGAEKIRCLDSPKCFDSESNDNEGLIGRGSTNNQSLPSYCKKKCNEKGSSVVDGTYSDIEVTEGSQRYTGKEKADNRPRLLGSASETLSTCENLHEDSPATYPIPSDGDSKTCMVPTNSNLFLATPESEKRQASDTSGSLQKRRKYFEFVESVLNSSGSWMVTPEKEVRIRSCGSQRCHSLSENTTYPNKNFKSGKLKGGSSDVRAVNNRHNFKVLAMDVGSELFDMSSGMSKPVGEYTVKDHKLDEAAICDSKTNINLSAKGTGCGGKAVFKVSNMIDGPDLDPKVGNNFTIDEIFDKAERSMKKAANQKYKELKEDINKSRVEETNVKSHQSIKSHKSDLGMKSLRLRTDLDEAMIELAPGGISNVPTVDVRRLLDISNTLEEEEKEKFNSQKEDIDPNKFLNVKPKQIATQVPELMTGGEGVEDEEEEDEEERKRMNLAEAFADDDVIDEFRRDKEEEIKESQPQDLDLTLPGWGSWGGCNIRKVTKRKRKRFIVKFPILNRKDNNRPNIIITERGNQKIRDHMVSDLPHPFTSVKDFEASVRAPLGSTWVPQLAQKKLILQPFVTKKGTVIEPIDDSQLLNKKKKK
ncbi:hypothetical protein AAG570_014146 [Ranatra chinensis]|uniref:Uncharacterized protein n=1 Tax=Ranatra chinensis TaxID=642074 RepID=A0ABD0XRT7_9HEMI